MFNSSVKFIEEDYNFLFVLHDDFVSLQALSIELTNKRHWIFTRVLNFFLEDGTTSITASGRFEYALSEGTSGAIAMHGNIPISSAIALLSRFWLLTGWYFSLLHKHFLANTFNHPVLL